MEYTPVSGTLDMMPEYHRYLTFIKKVFRHEFRKNGFRRISVPKIEKKEFLERAKFNVNFPIE
jgi:histidyl-tRNA synthetase